MATVHQSPTDPDFVQNPYPFYARCRAAGPLHYWEDYGMMAAFDYATVRALLRDKRFGREAPAEFVSPSPAHLAPFMAIESVSLLEAEPPRHTRLRSLVMRAFTSRQIAALEPWIESLCHELIDRFPAAPFDLLPAYCTPIPVLTICQLLGVPRDMAPNLLDWSHAMVAMYQAGRSREIEDRAAAAAAEFAAFLRDYVDERRKSPSDDLISQLIAAEQDGEKLSTDELIGTCILLLNAGHEATVHAMANATKTILKTGTGVSYLTPDRIDGLIEETLRFDPPLHMFTRYAYETVDLHGHRFERGDEVALLLGAANRDPKVWGNPDQFDPTRPIATHTSFGGGVHFCVGAPLARLELRLGLRALFDRCPDLRLASTPQYAGTYHFHGLTALQVRSRA